ncbi:MAG TPA: SDR family oxidoreductase [Promicromonospora sp.]|nr:SDR family oxidoreductase [Promicromonospora sp.]
MTMHVFVTGGSGWIGSASVDQLLADGHTVTALARSDASASALEAKGATVVRGDLDDLDVLRRGADAAEAVLHLANKHDFANPAATNAAERAAVQTLGDALAGSGRPFLVAAGIAGVVQGRPATEADAAPFHGPDSPRGGSENLALELVEKDVHAVALRFAPSVHGRRDHGFMAVLHDVARRTGVAAYPGDGTNAWAAVHRSDAARLVSLALSKAPAGARVHATAEVGVPTRDIAEAIGGALGLPVASVPSEQVIEHFGWIGGFFGQDLRATSTTTRQQLGWEPTGPVLLEDIAAGAYTAG